MSLGRMAAGMAVKAVLNKVTRRPTPPREERDRPERRARPHADPQARLGPLFFVMAGSIALAAPLMIIFHSTPTRILGVTLLFTFIISGVFAIADPRFLDDGRESRH